MKGKLSFFLTLAVVLSFAAFGFSTNANAQATITSAGTGDWSTGATWVGAAAPAVGDNIVIDDGHAVTFDASALAGIYGTLKLGAGSSLILARDSLTVTTLQDSETQVTVGLVGYRQASGTWEPVPGFDSIAAGQLDLSGVDANEYPFIKLNGTLTTDNRYKTPALKEWSISYQPAGELILSSFKIPPDSVILNDTATICWTVHNQGYAEIESCQVRLQAGSEM